MGEKTLSSKNVRSNIILVWVQKKFGLKDNFSQKEFENNNIIQAGTELGQAQVKLEVIV